MTVTVTILAFLEILPAAAAILLSVAISADGGKSWTKPKDVAQSNGLQISYPGITQAADGYFVAVWQEQLPDDNGREIRWARFNRAWVLAD